MKYEYNNMMQVTSKTGKLYIDDVCIIIVTHHREMPRGKRPEHTVAIKLERIRAGGGTTERNNRLYRVLRTYREISPCCRTTAAPISAYYANSVVNMEIIGNNMCGEREYVPLKNCDEQSEIIVFDIEERCTI